MVTERCVIGANCSLLSKETLPPGTVITGNDHLRWTRQATTQVCKIEIYMYIYMSKHLTALLHIFEYSFILANS